MSIHVERDTTISRHAGSRPQIEMRDGEYVRVGERRFTRTATDLFSGSPPLYVVCVRVFSRNQHSKRSVAASRESVRSATASSCLASSIGSPAYMSPLTRRNTSATTIAVRLLPSTNG